MSKSGLIPKSVRRSDGVMTTVWVKADSDSAARSIPAPSSTAPVEGKPRVFAKGDRLSSAEDYELVPERTIIQLQYSGDLMIKRPDGWVYMSQLGIAGGVSSASMANRPSTIYS